MRDSTARRNTVAGRVRITGRVLRAVVGVMALVVVTGVLALQRSNVDPAPALTSVDQALWDRLLERYVDADGRVAYHLLGSEGRAELEGYLAQLAKAKPAEMPQREQLAFWINAYNAGIVAAILRGYSPETALSRAQLFRWYSFTVAGKERTADEIEHTILQGQFREPRIHFALVCGASSCPKFRREAYRGDRLEEQLDDQARRFINDPRRNRIDPASGRVELSSIFKWFAGDFAAAHGSVEEFVARYVELPSQAELLRRRGRETGHLEYDWALNAQPENRSSQQPAPPPGQRSALSDRGVPRAGAARMPHSAAWPFRSRCLDLTPPDALARSRGPDRDGVIRLTNTLLASVLNDSLGVCP